MSRDEQEDGVTDDVFVVETSLAQRSLWFVNEMDPGLPAYNVTAVVRIRGPLAVDVLRRALGVIVDRHEILRTLFREEAGSAVQVIYEEMPVDVSVTDVDEDITGPTVRRLVQEWVRTPFDLANGPLLRMRLLRVDEQNHVAVLVMHHIVTDAWSSVIFFRELSACYEAFADGREPDLEPLPIQYADYAVWENETLRGERLEKLVDYWRWQLADLGPVGLPVDRVPSGEPSFDGDVVRFPLPGTVRADVERLAREHGVTPFVLLLAVFATLLARNSGQDDIAVATPVANRERPELRGLIGYFVNMLVMRTDLSGDPTFAELLSRARAVWSGAIRHQQLPFAKLVEVLRPQRHVGVGTPLAQVMFGFQDVPGQPWKCADLTLEPTWTPTGTAKFEMALSIEPDGDEQMGVLEYSTELFDRRTAERLARQFRTLLRGALDHPGRRISELPLLPDDERLQLLGRGRASRSGDPTRRGTADSAQGSVLGLLDRVVREQPEAVAAEDADRRVTYQELSARAGRLAHELRASGVEPETPVAVVLDRPVELIVGWLAVLGSGGVLVPVDPDSPPERTARLLDRSGTRHVVTGSATRDRLDGTPVRVVLLDELPNGAATTPETALDVRVPSDQLACVAYAADGAPGPGHMITHADLAAMAASHRPGAAGRSPGPATFLDIFAGLVAGVPVPLPASAGSDRAPAPALGPGAEAVVPLGLPLDAVDAYVLDERMEPVPPGVVGELYVGGPSAGRGYWREPAPTAERFVPDPFTGDPGARLYRTGHVAKLVGSGIDVVGRADRRVKIRGFPVSPEQLEALLARHPDVADCAVVPVRGDAGGLESHAFVVPVAGRRPSLPDLRQQLASARQPNFVLPTRIDLVDDIPRTAGGAVDQDALPVTRPAHGERAAAPPRTPVEQELAAMVAELLAVNQVDMNENFIELGGHSLIAIQLVSRVREEFGVELPLRLLYSPDATLGDFAEVMFDEMVRDDPVESEVPG
ncbi:condensation domain-containing protein [Actinomadura sp. 9N215]|uniref:condensation domain-containing protein n=1 Tax=Actinomadura sp. 9N215 TaxID=3375150 RepID=UPI0037B227C9